MLHVALVGDQGSGKTTFLGLLYATLVRSGSDTADNLRFHTDYDSLEHVTALFQQMMSGGFPDAAIKEGLHALSFTLALRGAKRGILPRLGARKWNADTATSVRFTAPGSLGEETPGFLQGSSVGTGPWRDVLDADAILVLADSTKLAPKGDDSEAGPMGTYDGQVADLLAAIQRWRSRSGQEVLHPIFIFSKFDSVSSEALRAADLDATPPDLRRTGPRAAYSSALLKPNLPRTLGIIEEKRKGRLRFTEPDYFFSWVRPDAKDSGATQRIRLRRIDGGGWEPEYSREEYVAFLERLADIAARTKT
jgi:hypothetical protein